MEKDAGGDSTSLTAAEAAWLSVTVTTAVCEMATAEAATDSEIVPRTCTETAVATVTPENAKSLMMAAPNVINEGLAACGPPLITKSCVVWPDCQTITLLPTTLT